MKYIKFSLVYLSLMFLTGCWDIDEPERMLYVHGLGIDYKDGKYEVYAQVINLSNVAKSEEPKTDIEQAEVGYANGDTLEDAIFNLYRSADERILWGHLTYIVFSKDVLEHKHFNAAIDVFIRFAETRYRIWVYSTEDHVKDVLLTVPIISTTLTLSKLSDPMNSFEQESFVEPIDFRKLIIGLNEPNHEMIIPTINVIHNWETVEKKTRIAHLAGVGVITPNEFKGFILDEQARGLKWMNNQTKRGTISFLLDKSDKNSITSATLKNVKVKVEPIVKSDAVLFDIDVKMQAVVSTVTEKITDAEFQEHIANTIKAEILMTYEEALEKDIDLFRLSEHVYRKRIKDWKRLQKNGKVELTKDSIRSLNVTITKLKIGRKSLKETIE
ncbi:MAG TPA: Ger(x)C family spore germination protein [Cerasibacillus sp.]|uniref:Ger(x)C family spore germination protein n=1 Tax=Cerasibacillus sp. TaxID=2498711 RepID=UPI002F416D28